MESQIRCPVCGNMFAENEQWCPSCLCASKFIPESRLYNPCSSMSKVLLVDSCDAEKTIETVQRFHTELVQNILDAIQHTPATILRAIPKYGNIDAEYIATAFTNIGDIVIVEDDMDSLAPLPYGDRARKKECNKSLDATNQEYCVPRCPTCGSTKVRKLSLSARCVSLGLFGLASKTARSQFVCENCGYKW